MTDQKKVYKLDSVEQINFLMDKLDDDWRIWLMDGKPLMEIEVRFHKERRRKEQNALYWATIDEITDQMPAHGFGHVSKRGWDKFFRVEFLGIDSDEVNGKIIESPMEHSHMGVHDFADYLTQVIQWADEHDIVMRNSDGYD
jgi:hypothetical protein